MRLVVDARLFRDEVDHDESLRTSKVLAIDPYGLKLVLLDIFRLTLHLLILVNGP